MYFDRTRVRFCIQHPMELFGRVFFRKLIANSSIYLVLSDKQRKAAGLREAKRKGIIVAFGEDTDCDYDIFVPRAQYLRLEKYREMHRDLVDKGGSLIVNLNQNPAYFKAPKENVAPALLRQSILWDLIQRDSIL